MGCALPRRVDLPPVHITTAGPALAFLHVLALELLLPFPIRRIATSVVTPHITRPQIALTAEARVHTPARAVLRPARTPPVLGLGLILIFVPPLRGRGVVLQLTSRTWGCPPPPALSRRPRFRASSAVSPLSRRYYLITFSMSTVCRISWLYPNPERSLIYERLRRTV